jgi:hypothetical protein
MAYEMGCSARTVWAWEHAGRGFHFQGKLHREKLDLLAEVVKDRDPARRS